MKLKNLTSIVLLILFCTSCKKEIAMPDITSNAKKTVTANQNIDYSIDIIGFDSCTMDSIHLTGILKLTFNYVIIGNILQSTFQSHWTNVKGFGWPSGMQYVGVSHFINTERIMLDGTLTPPILNQTAKDKAIFIAPGGQNLKSDFSLHLIGTVDSVRVERLKFNFWYCN